MCRHCENLTEDKEQIHYFMDLTVRRVNAKATVDGVRLTQSITADDIDIRIEVDAKAWQRNPLYSEKAHGRILRTLRDMNA